jgi:hypothetical protein
MLLISKVDVTEDWYSRVPLAKLRVDENRFGNEKHDRPSGITAGESRTACLRAIPNAAVRVVNKRSMFAVIAARRRDIPIIAETESN